MTTGCRRANDVCQWRRAKDLRKISTDESVPAPRACEKHLGRQFKPTLFLLNFLSLEVTMSLPTKQEVVSKAHTLGFSERIKFGAKLGHAQASNAELSTLLKSVRDVRTKYCITWASARRPERYKPRPSFTAFSQLSPDPEERSLVPLWPPMQQSGLQRLTLPVFDALTCLGIPV